MRRLGGAQIFLENVIHDSVTYTEHARRKRVTAMDVVGMLSRDRTGLFVVLGVEGRFGSEF